MSILPTGAAGFIGYSVCRALLQHGDSVRGLDNLSNYYDVRLKQARLEHLQGNSAFSFVKLNISSPKAVVQIFADGRFDTVVHFAAQASVRYSMGNPHAYGDANLTGFLNILEGCGHAR
jgi:UDP-glucuronate 4-epimerase